MIKRMIALLVASLIVATFSPVRAADPYEITAILPLTGPGAFLGAGEAQGLNVLETVVNKAGGISGRQIKFVMQDDQSSPQAAVQLANVAIEKQVPVIIGSSLAGSCGAMAPLTKQGPVLYCLSPGLHPAPGSYAFSAGPTTADFLAASVRYLRERGLQRLAVITSTDATGQEADASIDATLNAPENKGEVIVDREHFNTSDISVSAQMAHIKASGAQAVIVWSTGTPFGTVLRGAVEAAVDLPIMTSSGNLTYAQMKAYASFLPKDLYSAAPPAFDPVHLADGPIKKAVISYNRAFKAAGIRPDEGAILEWDPALIILDALKNLGVGATASQIKDYLEKERGWVGVFGPYDFTTIPQRGIGANSLVVVRWNDAKQGWDNVSKLGGSPL